ncbi:hypothetical protein Tco_1229755 [Tanacetum coccineum]
MSQSSIRNYKGKKFVKEEEPNDEWVNPTSDDNIILGNYMKKCLSDGSIWYKMRYPLPYKLYENKHPHTAFFQCCKEGIKVQNNLKEFHEEMREIHYSLNNNFKLLCLMETYNPGTTMEEYVQFDIERALKNGKVYNWETAKYGMTNWYLEDVDINILIFFEPKFPAIIYNDALKL